MVFAGTIVGVDSFTLRERTFALIVYVQSQCDASASNDAGEGWLGTLGGGPLLARNVSIKLFLHLKTLHYLISLNQNQNVLTGREQYLHKNWHV